MRASVMTQDSCALSCHLGLCLSRSEKLLQTWGQVYISEGSPENGSNISVSMSTDSPVVSGGQQKLFWILLYAKKRKNSLWIKIKIHLPVVEAVL